MRGLSFQPFATGLAVLLILAMPGFAAAETTVSGELQYIFNTLMFLIGGFMVMLMAAGFCMLEAGFVRSTSVSTICVKNIAIYAIAGLMYYVLGYNLMYDGVDGGYFGSIGLWGIDDSANIDIEGNFIGKEGAYAAGSDWFFQMVFVGTAASIVSGAVAERTKLWSFLIFSAILCGVIYPITGAWNWGGGWLKGMGFSDFAGSTMVHSVGGWAALMGVLLIGARKGRFGKDGKSYPMPGSSVPLATLGTFILWMGWFGFNGASQLALGTATDATAIATVFVNTNIAACAGLLVAMVFTQITFKKIDPSMTLNGALAGLVSITAEPLTPGIGEAAIIGGIGSLLMVLAVPMLDRMKIDDVVGAIPVHLVCGIWGTLAVPFTNPETNFVIQIMGVVSIGVFAAFSSLIVWLIIQAIFGLRISNEMEEMGIDQAEVGLDAYPDFVRTSKY
jgi:Amt family ammonium transporter